MIDGLFMK